MHHPVLPSVHQLRLAEFDAAIGKAEAQLAHHRRTLALRTQTKADTTMTEALVRRVRVRIALLTERRFLLLFSGRPKRNA
jgi:hypothetical protein